MDPGEYLICVAGQYGKELTNAIVSTPGGIILKVTKPGDVDGNGTVAIKDLATLRKYLVDTTRKIDMSNADMSGDGKVTVKDAALLRKSLVQ